MLGGFRRVEARLYSNRLKLLARVRVLHRQGALLDERGQKRTSDAHEIRMNGRHWLQQPVVCIGGDGPRGEHDEEDEVEVDLLVMCVLVVMKVSIGNKGSEDGNAEAMM